MKYKRSDIPHNEKKNVTIAVVIEDGKAWGVSGRADGAAIEMLEEALIAYIERLNYA